METRKTLITDDNLKKEFNIVIPREVIALEVEKAIADRQSTYKLDGFRTGKVPLDIIKQREYVSSFYRTADNFINKFIFALAGENNYELALNPRVNIKSMEPDSGDIELDVTYELMPKIDSIDIKTIKLGIFRVIVGEGDVDKSIETLLSMHKNFVKKEGPAQMGDKISINFSGTIGGENFPGNYAENFWIILGSGGMIGNFEEQIVGRNVGDEFNIEVTFPVNYHSSSLSGKTAIFEIELLEILKPEKVTLSDEFVKNNFGVENVEKFREIICDELTKKCSLYSRNIARNKLFAYLDQNMAFDLPEGLVKEEYDSLLKSRREYNLKNSLEDEIDLESLKKEAVQNIKINLILTKICTENNITVNESEVASEVMKEAMNKPGREMEVINLYKNKPRYTNFIRGMILERKVIDFILNNAIIEEKDITIGEVAED
ncbi:MAG: trigger factor [Rickettsiales bacterium]|jgi:trigger factor|nr:trigger factor [Rickettsiales bacterium]